ncbi:MAG TPA: diguanylate cyclase [Anaerolineales bacterium]|nr:diguanylate cyclase [Anaerolineales bacterium]
MFKFTVIAATLLITASLNIISTTISWSRAKSRIGLYFAIGMTGVTFWTLASGLDYAAIPIPLKIYFAKWEYVFYHITLVFFLMFIMSFAGYKTLLKNKLVITVLWVIPTINILLAWTNDWTGWLWVGFVESNFGNNTIIFEHGFAFLWVTATGYMLLASIIAASWIAMRRSFGFARRQGQVLFYGSLLPLIGNLIYLFQPPAFDGVDWSSIFISGSSVLFLWAFYGTNLINVIPIAREKLIDRSGDGMIVLDSRNYIIDINESAAKLLNLTVASLLGKKLADYLPDAKFLSREALEEELSTELEIEAPTPRFFDVLVTPLFEGQKTIIGSLVVLRDITKRRQNELRLLLLNQTVEQSPNSVVITDFDGKITYVNSAFTAITGYSAKEVLGKKTSILKSGYMSKEVYENLWQTILSGKTWEGELNNMKKGGELFWENTRIAPLLNQDGEISNFVAIKVDITERKRAQDELERMAITDPLTGLFNRRYFFEVAQKEFLKSIRYNRPLSVVLFDIDMFKSINDTYGHLAGDQILAQIGVLLTQKERETDLSARYGGEEFVLLLPETDCEGARNTAERLRSLLETSPIYYENHKIQFTASFGVAGIGNRDYPETFDYLILQADKALYEAKRISRNTVICSCETQSEIK